MVQGHINRSTPCYSSTGHIKFKSKNLVSLDLIVPTLYKIMFLTLFDNVKHGYTKFPVDVWHVDLFLVDLHSAPSCFEKWQHS